MQKGAPAAKTADAHNSIEPLVYHARPLCHTRSVAPTDEYSNMKSKVLYSQTHLDFVSLSYAQHLDP